MTSEGLFQYRYMSFGMSNAPSEINRVMRTVLSDLIPACCLCYMDDILVHAPTWSLMLERLDKVLSRLITANLTVKPSKCSWGMEKIDILGHIVSNDGVECDPEKLQAISRMRIPTSVKDVRSIIGMCSYYRSFIPNFSTITAPLNELLKKDIPFKWSNTHDQAFQDIKSAMLLPTVLAHFDPSKDIQLHTDASYLGLGGVLMQKHGTKYRPVCYASRTLTPAEKNYSVTEIECLAVVYCTDKFRDLLFGQELIILTDHCALCALKMCKNPANPRLARWQLKLQNLHYTVVYVKGKQWRRQDPANACYSGQDFLDVYSK